MYFPIFSLSCPSVSLFLVVSSPSFKFFDLRLPFVYHLQVEDFNHLYRHQGWNHNRLSLRSICCCGKSVFRQFHCLFLIGTSRFFISNFFIFRQRLHTESHWGLNNVGQKKYFLQIWSSLQRKLYTVFTTKRIIKFHSSRRNNRTSANL